MVVAVNVDMIGRLVTFDLLHVTPTRLVMRANFKSNSFSTT